MTSWAVLERVRSEVRRAQSRHVRVIRVWLGRDLYDSIEVYRRHRENALIRDPLGPPRTFFGVPVVVDEERRDRFEVETDPPLEAVS